MRKVTLIIPDGYDELLTISCIGHYPYSSTINVATRAHNIMESKEITIDLTNDIHTAEKNEGMRDENVDQR